MLLSHVLLSKEERGGRRGIKISSGSGAGDFEGLIRIEVGQEDSCLCRWWNVLYTLYVYLDFIVIAICFP